MRNELPAELPAPVEEGGCVRFTPSPQRRHCSARLCRSTYQLIQRSRAGLRQWARPVSRMLEHSHTRRSIHAVDSRSQDHRAMWSGVRLTPSSPVLFTPVSLRGSVRQRGSDFWSGPRGGGALQAGDRAERKAQHSSLPAPSTSDSPAGDSEASHDGRTSGEAQAWKRM
ncbi:hypothetical protein NDU88_007496 [Pleurodeles waltl]|uniref:Uncharacterized protein n=1 Tax=Pleurodeles waltl TaxID=8319 RepID=A0AAV7N3L6_PLEWA|nr:hypothetical protein NDU88_007496 [Pleurodeles waltl]